MIVTGAVCAIYRVNTGILKRQHGRGEIPSSRRYRTSEEIKGGRVAVCRGDTIGGLMSSLSPDILQFARSHIRSLEDLQVFITCADHPERWWDAIALARRIFISEARAIKALDAFVRANLLDIRISDAVRYRFNPGTEELAVRAASFSAAYHRSPTEIVRLVARTGVPDSVRDFADAFRIKRDDSR